MTKFLFDEPEWSAWNTVHATGEDETTWSDTEVSTDAYQYRVRACGIRGCSNDAFSNTAHNVDVPAAPADIGVQVGAYDTTHTLPYGMLSATATGVLVIERREQVDGEQSGWVAVDTVDAGALPWEDRTLVWGRRYRYRLSACNVAGCSEFARTSWFRAIRKPGAPVASPTFAAVFSVTTGVSLTTQTADAWTDSVMFERRMRVSGGWSEWVPTGRVLTPGLAGAQVSLADAAVDVGRRYRYRARACNVAGCSDWVVSVVVNTFVAPLTDLTLGVESQDGSAGTVLQWNVSTATPTIEIQRRYRKSAESWNPWQRIGVTTGDEAVYFDGAAFAGVEHRYRVRACGPIGCSAWILASYTAKSCDDIGDCPAAVPVAPTITSAFMIDVIPLPALSVLWTDNSNDETSFEVHIRSRDPGGASGAWTATPRLDANQNQYNDPSADVTKQHQLRVRSCNTRGCSAWQLTDWLSTDP